MSDPITRQEIDVMVLEAVYSALTSSKQGRPPLESPVSRYYS
jgi:hypothetical protein